MKNHIINKLSLYLFILFFLSSCATGRFTPSELQIIQNINKEGRLRVLLVENTQDSIVLYKKSKSINADSENTELQNFVQALFKTVQDPNKPGIGIAAPQVGINRSVIWVQRFDKEGAPFEVYFNIKIKNYSGEKKDGMEGCLSVDNYRGTVARASEITIEYDTFTQQNKVEIIKGFTAVIFQHEIDHLNGILYTDRIQDKSLLVRTQ